jgi:hypothetical protein
VTLTSFAVLMPSLEVPAYQKKGDTLRHAILKLSRYTLFDYDDAGNDEKLSSVLGWEDVISVSLCGGASEVKQLFILHTWCMLAIFPSCIITFAMPLRLK